MGAACVLSACIGMLLQAPVAWSQPIEAVHWLTPEVRAAVRAVSGSEATFMPGRAVRVSGAAEHQFAVVAPAGEASLRDATLRDATLRDATLRDATLRDASLRDASLRDATLSDWVPAGAPRGDSSVRGAPLGEWPQPSRVPMPGGVSPWVSPLVSAILPGAGQGLLRQQRGVVYAAAEGYLVLQAIRSNRDAARERDAYREIARSVARAAFGGSRPDGDWPYYERMKSSLESGQFNRTPGNGFTPEHDASTFNGSIWQLARETFWRDPETAPATTSPEYQRAIAFYQRRAATDEFRWSWRDAQLEQDVYRQTIVRANEASRRTKQVVGLLLANHALSLVDSYMSVRLRVFGTAGTAGTSSEQRLGVSGSLPWRVPGGR